VTLEVWAPDGVPEIADGADLTDLLPLSDLRDGDVVLVTSKAVSKAEGRVVRGDRDDAIAAETERVVARRGPTTIARTRHGITLAAAGVDASNVAAGRLVLLPRDPDASARRLREEIHHRTGRNVAVVVTDTAGRAWRHGQTDLAIGAAGLVVLEDLAGREDGYGNLLSVTAPAVADELAGAAELAQGKLTGRPFAVVRGRDDLVLDQHDHGPGARALVRPAEEDLFGLGAREAVLRALAGDPAAATAYGAPASRSELADAVGLVTGLPVADDPGDGSLLWPGTDSAPQVVAALALACGWRVGTDSADRVTLFPGVT